MKKFYVFILCVVLACAVSIPVSAADEYANAGELYQVWYENMPDYITGVWSTDGSGENLTFGIKADADMEAVKAEILSLIKNDASVSFAVQKYSMNELRRINDELLTYFPGPENDADYGLIGMGIYDTSNVIIVEILEARKDDPVTVAFIEEITGKYGDAISIAYGENYVQTLVSPITTDVQKKASSAALFGVFGGVILFFMGFILYLKRKQSVMVLQTAGGAAVTESEKLSVREVETMIRGSEMTVPDTMEEKIMQKIDSAK